MKLNRSAFRARSRKRKTVHKRAVSKQLEPVTDLAKLKNIRGAVYGIHGLGDAIRVMHSSNRLMGRAMGEYRADRDNYSPSTVSHWRHPRAQWSVKMNDDNLNHAALVLDDWVKRELGRGDVQFDMTVNSPWKCSLLIQCGCGHWEKLDLRRKDCE